MGLFSKEEQVFSVGYDEITIITKNRLSGKPTAPDKVVPMNTIYGVRFCKPSFRYKGFVQLLVDGCDETKPEYAIFFEDGSVDTNQAVYNMIMQRVTAYYNEHPEYGRRFDLPDDMDLEMAVDSLANTFKGNTPRVATIRATDLRTSAPIGDGPNTERDLIDKEAAAADALKKYKELFDQGVITQEEFEAKKKLLLGL